MATTNKSSSRATKTKKSGSVIKKDVLGQLNAWHWLLGLIYAIGGGLVLAWGNDVYRSVNTSYATNDSILGIDGSAPIVQSTRTLFDVNITYIVVAVLFASAAAYLLRASTLRKAYESRLTEEHGMLRWLEHGVGSGLMLVTISLVAGVSNLGALVAIAIMPLIALRGWRLMESINHNRKFNAINWGGFNISLAAHAVAWAIIVLTLCSQRRYADTAPESYIYWLVGSTFVIMVLQALIWRAYFRTRESGRDYLNAEWTHIVLSLVLKTTFAGIIFYHLLK